MKRAIPLSGVGLVLVALLAPGLGAQGPPAGELFASDSVLRFTLSAPFQELEDDRSQDSEERPATVLVTGTSGDPVELQLKVKHEGGSAFDPISALSRPFA